MRFSPKTIEQFRQARHEGITSRPSVVGLAGNLEGGLFVMLALRCAENRIVEARFRCFNCISAIAAADWVCETIEGQNLALAREISPEEIDIALDRLPTARKFCAQMTSTALRAALDNAESKGFMQ